MSLKDPGARILYLVMLCSLFTVIAALFLHRLALLFYLTFTFISILVFIWGAPFIFEGIKELRAARKNGEKVAWQSNKFLVKGLSLILPCAITYITSNRFSFSTNLRGNNGILFDIIRYIIAFVLAFPILFLLIALTIAAIRYILNTPHPYAQYIQDAFVEKQPSDE